MHCIHSPFSHTKYTQTHTQTLANARALTRTHSHIHTHTAHGKRGHSQAWWTCGCPRMWTSSRCSKPSKPNLPRVLGFRGLDLGLRVEGWGLRDVTYFFCFINFAFVSWSFSSVLHIFTSVSIFSHVCHIFHFCLIYFNLCLILSLLCRHFCVEDFHFSAIKLDNTTQILKTKFREKNPTDFVF